MKPILLIITAVSLVLCSCSTAPGNRATGTPGASSAPGEQRGIPDGLSFASAIVIHADGESAGVAAEYAWIRENLPGARPEGQSLRTHAGKPYDVIEVELAAGGRREVFFEISSYFGRF